MQRDKVIAYIISETANVSKHRILNSEKCDTAIIETELQDASEFNRNGRNYRKDVLDQGLNDAKIKELIKNKSWVGEAGHPHKPDLQRQMTIDPNNISHRILDWWWEGEKVMGVVETLNTQQGIAMRNLIRQELNTAYSLRAVGPVTKSPKGIIVQKPLSVLTYDWVFVPSHKNSYQRRILNGTDSNMSESMNLSESYCVPIQEAAALDYIANESENFKLLSKCYDFANGDLALSESGVIYTTSDGKTTNKMHLNIEDYIVREINGTFDKYRN